MLHFWRPLFSTLALSCGSGCLVLPTHPLANTFTPTPPTPPLTPPPTHRIFGDTVRARSCIDAYII